MTSALPFSFLIVKIKSDSTEGTLCNGLQPRLAVSFYQLKSRISFQKSENIPRLHIPIFCYMHIFPSTADIYFRAKLGSVTEIARNPFCFCFLFQVHNTKTSRQVICQVLVLISLPRNIIMNIFVSSAEKLVKKIGTLCSTI